MSIKTSLRVNNLQPGRGSAVRQIIQSEQDEIDLSEIVRTIWRGKVFIAFCAIVATFIGGWYAYSVATPVFTSRATVALESRQEQVVDIESVVTGLSGDQATINTEVEVIRSRGIIEKLVARMNLVEDPEFNPHLRPEPSFSIGKAINMVRDLAGVSPPAPRTPTDRAIVDSVIDEVLRVISVSNIRQTFVFQITATSEGPEKAAELANTLAQLYILEQLETKFDATEQATTWLTDRVSDLQVELEAAEAEVKDFNASAQLVSPEALTGLNRQIKELRDRLRDTRVSAEEASARLAALREAQQTGDIMLMAELANDPTLNRAVQLMQNSGSANPDRSAFDVRFDQIVTRVELDTARAASQSEALRQTIAEQEQQIEEQSADLVKLQQLQREANASRLIYEFFLNRLKETSVQEGIQQADSRILSQAVVPTRPSAPRRSLILAISMAAGLLLGGGIVLLREFMQTTFRDAVELEQRTGYTVIGQIPVVPARRRKNVLKYLTDKPTSAAAEAIRNLRTSVLLSNIDNPPQVIMSTSSIPTEGKTTQSLALTQNLSGLGKKVLLIEGDIRRRVFSQYFEVKEKAGLLSVLSGDAKLSESVIHIDDLGADILVGEKAKTNAADIFSSEKFTNFLNAAREEYDYIIIDTPPVLAVPDARIIGQSVDAIVYAVKWDKTSHRQVREGLKAFEDVNIRISGLVLSQISSKGMKRYGYGDSYAAYGAYYDN